MQFLIFIYKVNVFCVYEVSPVCVSMDHMCAWCLQRPEEGMDPLKQINNKNVKKKSKNIKISKRKMT